MWLGVLLVVSVLQMPATMQQLSRQPRCVGVPALVAAAMLCRAQLVAC
jgi:hypothetical protein